MRGSNRSDRRAGGFYDATRGHCFYGRRAGHDDLGGGADERDDEVIRCEAIDTAKLLTPPSDRPSAYHRLFEPKRLDARVVAEVTLPTFTITCGTTEVPIEPNVDLRLKKRLERESTRYSIRGVGPRC